MYFYILFVYMLYLFNFVLLLLNISFLFFSSLLFSSLLFSSLLFSSLLFSSLLFSSLLFSSLLYEKAERLHFLICITPYCSDIAFNRSVCGCSCRLPLEDPWSMVWLLTPDLGIFIISLITLILCSRLLKKREEGPIPNMSTLLQEVS